MKIMVTEQQLRVLNKFLITEGLDYSKPIIRVSKVGNTNYYNISGFVNFSVTSSNLAPQEVIDAINDVEQKLKTDGYQAIGTNILTVYGGASNYLSGAMKADKKPSNPGVPFTNNLIPAVNNLPSYPGEKNRDRNKGYAKSRAEVFKNALLKKYPLISGAKPPEIQSYIIDTGGLIDENRNEELYPVPGQQATFTAQLSVKKLPPPPSLIKDKFTQTETYRSFGNEVGPDPVIINGKTVNMCKILTKNTFFTLKNDYPNVGLSKFGAEIKLVDEKNRLYTITNSTPGSGGEFTKTQWIYVYWYLLNEVNSSKHGGKCEAIQYVQNLPSWLKTIDLSTLTFGAVNKDEENVLDKSKHDLVKK